MQHLVQVRRPSGVPSRPSGVPVTKQATRPGPPESPPRAWAKCPPRPEASPFCPGGRPRCPDLGGVHLRAPRPPSGGLDSFPSRNLASETLAPPRSPVKVNSRRSSTWAGTGRRQRGTDPSGWPFLFRSSAWV